MFSKIKGDAYEVKISEKIAGATISRTGIF
jgi:hypothetical protein